MKRILNGCVVVFQERNGSDQYLIALTRYRRTVSALCKD